jgi:hypothetical protein
LPGLDAAEPMTRCANVRGTHRYARRPRVRDDWHTRLKRDLRTGRITRRQFDADVRLYLDAEEVLERLGRG